MTEDQQIDNWLHEHHVFEKIEARLNPADRDALAKKGLTEIVKEVAIEMGATLADTDTRPDEEKLAEARVQQIIQTVVDEEVQRFGKPGEVLLQDMTAEDIEWNASRLETEGDFKQAQQLRKWGALSQEERARLLRLAKEHEYPPIGPDG